MSGCRALFALQDAFEEYARRRALFVIIYCCLTLLRASGHLFRFRVCVHPYYML